MVCSAVNVNRFVVGFSVGFVTTVSQVECQVEEVGALLVCQNSNFKSEVIKCADEFFSFLVA